MEKEAEKLAEKESEEEDIKKLLQMSEISLMLDTYDDIFSDFDPRPYSERSLSDDFLLEAKKATKGRDQGEFELRLMIPQVERDLKNESLIRKRLRSHFKRHFEILQKEKNSILKKGLMFTLSGVILMLFAAFVVFKYTDKSFITSFMVILLEPAGWFLFWEGLNLQIFDSKEVNPDLDFYRKMSRCEINFMPY